MNNIPGNPVTHSQPSLQAGPASEAKEPPKMKSIREALQGSKPVADPSKLNEKTWADLTKGKSQRKLALDILSKKEKMNLDEMKDLREAVDKKLNEKINFSDLSLQKIGKAIRTTFANIFAGRKTELQEIRAELTKRIDKEFGIQNIRTILTNINSEKYLNTEGIFRLSGRNTEIAQWLEGDQKLETLDHNQPHDVTGILKNLVGKHLSFDEELMKKAHKCFDENGKLDMNEAAKFKKELYDRDPTYIELFGLLSKVAEHSEVNQMHAPNLSICIAPRLMKYEGDPMKELAMFPIRNALVQWLIENPM